MAYQAIKSSHTLKSIGGNLEKNLTKHRRNVGKSSIG